MEKKRVFLDFGEGVRPDRKILNYIRENFLIVENPDDAKYVVVLGGDGRVLKATRRFWHEKKIIFALNFGHFGFLANDPTVEILKEFCRDEFEVIKSNMLKARLFDSAHRPIKVIYAFGDFYFERASSQGVRIKIQVDGETYFNPLFCDGALVCGAAGSTAYNASAGGPIFPVDTRCLVVTGLCPAIFHRWRSTQLSEKSKVILTAVETEWRPVRFLADGVEIAGVKEAHVELTPNAFARIAFAKSQNFRKKVTDLQFNAFRK